MRLVKTVLGVCGTCASDGGLPRGEMQCGIHTLPMGAIKTDPNIAPPTLACRSALDLDRELLESQRSSDFIRSGVWEPPNAWGVLGGGVHACTPSRCLSDVDHETRWEASLYM